MLKHDNLVRILSSIHKNSKDELLAFMDALSDAFKQAQVGLMTSNDFNHIRYLQGIGFILSAILNAYGDVIKAPDNVIIGGEKHE